MPQFKVGDLVRARTKEEGQGAFFFGGTTYCKQCTADNYGVITRIGDSHYYGGSHEDIRVKFKYRIAAYSDSNTCNGFMYYKPRELRKIRMTRKLRAIMREAQRRLKIKARLQEIGYPMKGFRSLQGGDHAED